MTMCGAREKLALLATRRRLTGISGEFTAGKRCEKRIDEKRTHWEGLKKRTTKEKRMQVLAYKLSREKGTRIAGEAAERGKV